MADRILVPLSALFKSPTLRRVFRDAERDSGAAFAVPPPRRPELRDGAAAALPVRSLELAGGSHHG